MLTAYHRLPPLARQAVASVRGYQLRRWRYGPDTDSQAADARARESWSKQQWQDWQVPRLQSLLKMALEKVPHYRMLWQVAQRGGNRRDVSNLADWPVLSKESLRRSPADFLVENTSLKRLRIEHTSGTTGTPMTLWQSQATVQAWYALMEARWRGWYGLSRTDRWAILGGQLVTPIHQKSPPFWVWNSGLHQLYLSSSHLSPTTCAAYLSALRKYQVVYLWGYASALYSLALFANDSGLKPPGLSLVISNAEPLYAHQRELIARTFACPVRDTYGMSEMVCAASECEAGGLHLWPETGVHEVLQDDSDQPVKPGGTGRLVCTGLLNRDMPLIRYETGDRVALASPRSPCGCGRTLPLLLSVEGRHDDVILTADGRRIGRMDPVFKGDIPMREGQIVQESLDLIRVLVVPGREFTARHEQALVEAVRERVGNISVKVELVREIPRSANGKFRAVISKVARADAVQKQFVKNGDLTN